MSLQPSADESPAVETTKQLRPILAWGLLGANALFLLFSIQALFIPGEGLREDFAGRAFNTLGLGLNVTLGTGALTVGFLGIIQLLLPVGAVLLTTHMKPVVVGAKVFLMTALAQIGVSLLFGVIALLGTFSLEEGDVAGGSVDGVGRFLTETAFYSLAMLALFGIAGFWTYKVAQPHLQSTPNYGGGYGQPMQGGWPQQGQQQWPQQGQQAGWPQQGQPEQQWPQGQVQPGQPQQSQPGQQWPQPGQPGQQGQQPQQGGWPQG